MSTRKVLLVALAAALLGAVVGLFSSGAGPLFRTEFGQRLLQGWLERDAPAPPTGTPVAQVGDRIPTITLPDLEGRRVTLPEAAAGRPMLINLWASWCAPCIEEMPELQRFAASQGKDGVQVVGIALDERAPVLDFLQKVPVDYLILLDVAGPADAGVKLGNTRGVLPYTVLVGADGRVLKRRIGPFEKGEIDGFAAEVTRR